MRLPADHDARRRAIETLDNKGTKGVSPFFIANMLPDTASGQIAIELGAKGVLELALNLGVALDDEMKYIRTNKQQETNIVGIYAAGDICGMPWQMAKAVGEGCVAGLAAAKYAKKRRKK